MREPRWYRVTTNQHGVPVRAGPRESAGHKNVYDCWDTLATTMQLRGPATVRCEDCGLEWPEGAERSPECAGNQAT